MNASNPSFLRAFVTRILGRAVPACGGYVFNFRGRWRYETHAERRAQRPSPRREWGGEALAYAWLSRQATTREPTSVSPARPDPQTLAVIRS